MRMRARTRFGRPALMAATALLLALVWSAPVQGQAATALSVNLAAPTRAATHVGEGFLYGMTVDGTLPADQFLLPLGITAFRGGGHASRGWIGDNYSLGAGTRADLNS